MKKERNCQMAPYPIYQYPMMPNTQGPMMPNMQGPIMMPNQDYQMDTSSLSNQINNLEKRVSALENAMGTNYNNSNFQMM